MSLYCDTGLPIEYLKKEFSYELHTHCIPVKLKLDAQIPFFSFSFFLSFFSFFQKSIYFNTDWTQIKLVHSPMLPLIRIFILLRLYKSTIPVKWIDKHREVFLFNCLFIDLLSVKQYFVQTWNWPVLQLCLEPIVFNWRYRSIQTNKQLTRSLGVDFGSKSHTCWQWHQTYYTQVVLYLTTRCQCGI